MSQISLRKETNLYDDLAIKAVNDKVVSQYAVSTTASSTVAKTATVDGNFELFKNARVSVFFQNANTATSPTLNIAGTGAKPIWAYGGPLSASGNTFNWVANSTIEFVYDGTHWLVADSGAVGLISKYDEKLNQEVVFNKLTNNGSIRGIFMQNGQMYINMDYLQTGTLKLGGVNNDNGLMVVYNASGAEIGRWDKDGLTASGSLRILGEGTGFTSTLSLIERKTLIDNLPTSTTQSIAYASAFGEYLVGVLKSTSVTHSVWFRTPYRPTYSSSTQYGISDTSWTEGNRNTTHFYTTENPDVSAAAPTTYQEFDLSTDYGSTPGFFGKIVDKINNTHTVFFRAHKDRFSYGTSNTDASSAIASTYKGEAQLKIDTTGIRFHGGTSSAVAEISVVNSTISAANSTVNYSVGAYTRINGTTLTITAGDTYITGYPKIDAAVTSTTKGVFYLYATGDIWLGYTGTYWQLKEGTSRSGTIQITGSSSKRYKHDITADISEELDAHRLYDLDMKQFVFNDDHPLQYADMKGKTLPGFIAEEVAEIYPSAVIHTPDGEIESWDERRIIPGMLALIQEQKKQLDEQTERIAKLENQTSFIHIS